MITKSLSVFHILNILLCYPDYKRDIAQYSLFAASTALE